MRRQIEQDFELSLILHDMLDDPLVDQDTKLTIIKWFDSFEYRTFTTKEVLINHANAIFKDEEPELIAPSDDW